MGAAFHGGSFSMTHPKPFGELSDEEKGELLLEWYSGKRIEYLRAEPDMWKPFNYSFGTWLSPHAIYRIAPEPLIPDSINWDHVAPEWKYMVRLPNGDAILLRAEPIRDCGGKAVLCGSDAWQMAREPTWDFYGMTSASAHLFASYKRGTVDWKDSLVIRPGHESSKS
jgi:hypothetical protein